MVVERETTPKVNSQNPQVLTVRSTFIHMGKHPCMLHHSLTHNHRELAHNGFLSVSHRATDLAIKASFSPVETLLAVFWLLFGLASLAE